MSRLPIIGGDYDSWGTVLNDYLTKAAGVATMASSPSAGATTFDLALIPPGLIVGSIVAIDAFTTQCEIRSVTGISGNTVTVAAFKFAHASGDTMMVINNATVPVAYFGLTGDGTDEWQPLQRLLKETAPLELAVKGDKNFYKFQQPLLCNTGTRIEKLQLETRAGFAPVESNCAAIMSGNGEFFFTANSSTDVFTSTGDDYTTPVTHNLGPGTLIVFNNPYSETLPGNLTSGKVYYVKTVPTTSTFTISDTNGGATVNLSSDGTGWSMNDPYTGLARAFWDTVYLRLSVTDLNGIWLNLQQPSWTRNTRIEMGADATAPGGAIGMLIDGQQSYNDNIEINTHANCIGLKLVGSGHIVRGFNDNGSEGIDDVGVLFEEAQNCAVYDAWTENVTIGMRIDATSRGVVIGGTWLGSMPTADSPMLQVVSTDTSYSLGMMRIQAGGFLFVSDTARSLALRSSGGGATDDVVGDSGLAFSGLRQPFGANAPVLTERTHTSTSTSRTIYHGEAIIEVNATAATKTMTLPLSTGWLGWSVTVINASTSGTFGVVVNCTGGQTIDGNSSVTIAIGEAVTFMAADGAYRRIAEFIP